MSTATQVSELHQLITGLRVCVTSLVSTYGDCPATRRVVNDAECILNGIHRLDIDIEDLELTKGVAQATASGEMIQIPDIQYDNDFWRDVDHEGIGGQNGAGAGVSRNGKRR